MDISKLLTYVVSGRRVNECDVLTKFTHVIYEEKKNLI